MKEKQRHIFLLVIVILFALTLSYGMIQYRGENFGLYEKQTYEMNTGWVLEDASGYQTEVTLPAELDIPNHTEYSISTYIPEDFPEGMSILYRTAQQSSKVLVDGKIIYERGQDTSMFPGEFRGSSWNIVLISKDYAGKKLTLTLMSPYENISGTINEVRYGYKSALMYYVIHRQLGQLLCATLMLLIGISLFLFHAIKAKSGASSIHITYLALFAVFCSFYLFGESRMLQFYTSNEFLVTALPFLSEIMFPIPLFMYAEGKWMPRHKWVAVMLQWVYFIDFLVTVALQFLGIADFYETIIIFHASVVATMIAIVIVSLRELIIFKYKESFIMTQALGVLIIGTAAGMWELYHQSFANVGVCLQIGIVGFELVMAVDAIQNFNQYEEQLREKAYYEKLAYIDTLTNGQNRNAYMDRIFKLTKEEKHKNRICYALFDMNNLKVINDTYGHATGDDAIQRTYRCLVKAFGRKGDCYRIGGDEFAVIMESCKEEDFETANKVLEHEIELNNREVDYQLSIAGGYALSEPEQELSFEMLMKQADQMLYRNKHKMKLKTGILGI